MKKLLLLAALLLGAIGAKLCQGATIEERVIKRSQDKVVKLGMVSADSAGVCSGAFISPDGLILTCAHCLMHHYEKLFVKTDDGTVYRGEPVLLDTDKDLALVKIIAHTPYFRLGKETQRGQEVIAFGSPFNIQHTVSIGYVENYLLGPVTRLVHSAPTNPGNSGGPVVNLRGELVGVNEGVIMTRANVPASGLFIAVDVNEVKDFLGGN